MDSLRSVGVNIDAQEKKINVCLKQFLISETEPMKKK